MTNIETQPFQKRKLIEGRLMRCPRCKRQHDILQYVPLEIIAEFAAETTPVYKCPVCKWIFAPADEMVAGIFLKILSRLPGETS